ncbi:MAG: dihydroxyacetone kinase subunit L [Chloroflexota bacterium]|nr:dihydroxyacetone kinase subunit L [Chloroflexota bacterium]
MDPNRQVDVGTLLQSVVAALGQNSAAIDQAGGNGSHGTRMVQAFQAAAQAAQSAPTNDAGQQFALAAQAMRQTGQGRASTYYANGLEQAAQQFQGRNGISAGDLPSLLQGMLGGAQMGNPAQPGQGTMIDALLPAVQAYLAAKQDGLGDAQAAMQAVGAAAGGARGTMRSLPGGSGSSGYMDPGAASATHVIGGIVGALLPGVLGSFLGGHQGGMQSYPSPIGGQGGYAQPGSQGGSNNDPLGGLGGLLGALGGAGGLGGLMGGSPSGSQSSGGGLGQILRGMGGAQGSQQTGSHGSSITDPIVGGLSSGGSEEQPGRYDGTQS